MKALANKLILPLMLILALLAISVIGCETDEVEGAPSIPPETTFVIDFKDFNSTGEAASATLNSEESFQLASLIFEDNDVYSPDQNAIGNKQNWIFAAGNVGVWSLLIGGGLAVPVASFVNSFRHTPEQQEDYTWAWKYNVKVGLVSYTAELHGKFVDDGVRWEMYISKQGEYTDFPWFYGESNLPATEGFWILKNKPSDPTDLLRINWERNLADSTYSIKYTNIVPDGPENGGYIAYGVTNDETYDRFYEIHNESANNYTYIEWQSTTTAGRVKAYHHFGDDNWHYWNADHENMETPI